VQQKYFSRLSTGKLILWCYLLWYAVTVVHYFDPNPRIWINSIGISLIIGFALLLSVSNGQSWMANKWQTARLFIMPFCVSSFSSLIKGQNYITIFPTDKSVLTQSIGVCVIFVTLVGANKYFNK
jgi:predicted neutral ceramidase superfamily lipid hydrolase